MHGLLVTYHRPLTCGEASGAGRLVIDTYAGLWEYHGRQALVLAPVRGRLECGGVTITPSPELRAARRLLLPLSLANVATREALLFLQMRLYVAALGALSKAAAAVRAPLLARLEPRAVVAEAVYTVPLARVLASLTGSRLVVRLHNIESRYLASLTHERLRRIAARLLLPGEVELLAAADLVVAVSWAEYSALRGVRGLRVAYAPPPVAPLDRRRARGSVRRHVARLIERHRGRYLLYVASAHKLNVEALRRSLPALLRLASVLKARLIVAGTVAAAARWLRSLGDPVAVLGPVTTAELKALYEGALAAVVVHHGHGAPVKLFEALNHAPAVVADNSTLASVGPEWAHCVNPVQHVLEVSELKPVNTHCREAYQRSLNQLAAMLNLIK